MLALHGNLRAAPLVCHTPRLVYAIHLAGIHPLEPGSMFTRIIPVLAIAVSYVSL